MVAPQKIHPPRTHECDLIWKRLFADIIKDLKTIIPDYVNPVTSVLIKLRHAQNWRRRQCEDEGRNWSDASMNQEKTKIGRRH